MYAYVCVCRLLLACVCIYLRARLLSRLQIHFFVYLLFRRRRLLLYFSKRKERVHSLLEYIWQITSIARIMYDFCHRVLGRPSFRHTSVTLPFANRHVSRSRSVRV